MSDQLTKDEELQQRRILEQVDKRFGDHGEKNDKRFAFKPVEWIVYAMVGSILMAFLAALISRVIPEKDPPANLPQETTAL